MAEDLVHLVEAELVVAGGNRSVGGEDAMLTDGLRCQLRWRCGAERRPGGLRAGRW